MVQQAALAELVGGQGTEPAKGAKAQTAPSLIFSATFQIDPSLF